MLFIWLALTPAVYAQQPRPANNQTGSMGSAQAPATTDAIRELPKRPYPPLDPSTARRVNDRMIENSVRGLGVGRDDWGAVSRFELCVAQRKEKTPPEVYRDLAVAYLHVGMFDSAVNVLEEGKRAVANTRESDRWTSQYDWLEKAARKVPAALAKAKAILIDKGVEVHYPDERIFMAALAATPPDDHLLTLNLADAYAGTFPNSINAYRYVAEANLSLAEQSDRKSKSKTNVPKWWANVTGYRGQWALRKVEELDKGNPYALIRNVQYGLRMSSLFASGLMPPDWMTCDLNGYKRLSDRQKAFVHFARAAIYLKQEWEVAENGYGAVLENLKAAARLDPESKLYAENVADFKKKKSQIILSKRIESGQTTQAAEQIYYGFLAAVWKMSIEGLLNPGKEPAPRGSRQPERCTACNGLGYTTGYADGLLHQNICWSCGGRGYR